MIKTQPISLLSGLIAAIAVPVTLHATGLSWNPSKIARDNGIVVLAEINEKPTRTGFRLAGPKDNPSAAVLDDCAPAGVTYEGYG